MATFFVRQDGSGTHTEIQAAIYDASVGDTVDVGEGAWNVNVDLYKGVILQGAGMTTTIIQGAPQVNFVKTPGYTCTLGSPVLNFASGTEGFLKGRIISGTGIPANSRIAAITANTVTISAPCTANRTVATNATMTGIIDGAIRMRGDGCQVKNMKVVGFDGPSPASEVSAIYVRNQGLGSLAATNYLIDSVHAVADGDYALLTDASANVANGTVTNCQFTGKTFSGDNPAIGNQFSVPNVPRQIVTVQGSNTGTFVFSDNLIQGTSGGLTVDGVPSFNVASTLDVPGSLIEGNTYQTVSGTAAAMRVRGANSVVIDNNASNLSPYSSSGFSLTGVGIVATNNTFFTLALSSVTQAGPGQPVGIEMNKDVLKAVAPIAADPVFSDESNWRMVTYVYKKVGSSARLFSTFKDFNANRNMKLRAGMSSGDQFQIHRIIVCRIGAQRELKVLKREQIDNAASYDFTLA